MENIQPTNTALIIPDAMALLQIKYDLANAISDLNMRFALAQRTGQADCLERLKSSIIALNNVFQEYHKIQTEFRYFDPANQGAVTLAEFMKKLSDEAPPPSRQDRYKTLFLSMKQMVGIYELVYDDRGEAVDYYVLDVNAAYETTLNMRREKLIGRLASRISPEIAENHQLSDLETYAQVVATGTAQEIEEHDIGYRFRVNIYPLGERQFAKVFTIVS